MRLFKRWLLWFQIYALDIYIHDMRVMLASIEHPEIRNTVITNIALAKAERADLCAAREALDVDRTWSLA